MEYSPRYRLFPTEEHREAMDWQRDTVRQVYNHALREFNKIPEDAGTLRQRVWSVRDTLPALKDWWSDLSKVYSTVLQKAVERIRTTITTLGKLKDNGYNLGSLNWKKPREYRSFTSRQSGFTLDTKSGPDNRAGLILKKLNGEPRKIAVRLHRTLPDHDSIREVTLNKEPTGAWYASFCISTDHPEKPKPEDIDAEDTVGIDLGVLNFIHDSDGCSVGRLDLSADRERLDREHRSLSRKERGSNNWMKQRRRVARVHAQMSNKKHDYKHKLAHLYATEYDAVLVEKLAVKSMLEGPQNARNKAEAGWREFITILEHHGDKHGCHVVEVEARGTTKEWAECGVEIRKPLWVREHSCPSCGFELTRDWNAALNVQQRGFERLGVVHSTDTPAETATAVDTRSVSASRVRQTASGGLSDTSDNVVETGSPCLTEAAPAAE